MNVSRVPVLALALVTLSACSTVSKVNKTVDKAGKALDNVSQLAKSFNDALTELKSSAKTATTASPAAAANVPALPATATGSVNVATPVAGKTGSGQADVDGSGTPETVQVFTPDASSVAPQSLHPLAGAAAEATTFLSWSGDAESGDEGACYLGWTDGVSDWFIIAASGEATGYVCSEAAGAVSCAACNEEGACAQCDEQQPLSACAAP